MHSTQVLVIQVVALGGAFALAACGSSNYNPAAATNPNTNSPLLLSQCMHSDGIKNFPDPTNGPGGFATGSGAPGNGSQRPLGVDPSSPAFKQAVSTCGGRGHGGFQVAG